MKKTLVALAAVAATTGAMAEATISGLFQIGLNQATATTTGTSTNTTSMDDSNANTGVNFKITEDLGDGMQFNAQIGVFTGINGVSGAVTGYETFGGLSGDFGSFRAGTFGSPQFIAITKGDAGGGYLINNAVADITQHQGGVIGSTTLFATNQIQYTLPELVSGLKLQYTNKMGEVAGSTAGTTDYYTADYTSGPINVGYVYSSYKPTTALKDTVSNIYGSYNAGPAKLYFMSANAAVDDTSSVKGTSIGVNVPIGAFTAMYNRSNTDGALINVAGTAIRTVNAQDQTGNFYGVSYGFSKRTTAYLTYYKNDGSDGATTATLNSTSSNATTRLILIHAF